MDAYNIDKANINRPVNRWRQRLLSVCSWGFSQGAELLVPGTCIVCDGAVAEQGGCCASCWGQINFIVEPRCPVMGTPFSIDIGEGMLCAEAIANPPPFNRLRAAVRYDDIARRLVSRFKYSDRPEYAKWFARWMINSGKELLEENPLIVPVPLHRSRLFSRRFNQSAEIARQITHLIDARKSYEPELLTRIKATKQQVGLSEKGRERNVSGAFRVPVSAKMRIRGAKVLLVDDVYTTGATTRAATRALLRAGAASVDVLVFAKVETVDL
ncbi:MAG: ComF family protein [Rhizobiaceae bacterium]|nr:ComF family protein [Rhizobiaceae bacterium]